MVSILHTFFACVCVCLSGRSFQKIILFKEEKERKNSHWPYSNAQAQVRRNNSREYLCNLNNGCTLYENINKMWSRGRFRVDHKSCNRRRREVHIDQCIHMIQLRAHQFLFDPVTRTKLERLQSINSSPKSTILMFF